MAFNIEDFKSNGLKNGGVRTSLFDVTITAGSWADPDFKARQIHMMKPGYDHSSSRG